MALTKAQREDFNFNLEEFKNYIEELKKDVNLYKAQMKKNKATEQYYQIAIILNSIKFMNTCLAINELSNFTLNLKSETYLNLARKEAYSVISNMEKVIGSDYENGLDENRELLDAIPEFKPDHRLNFIRGFRKTVNDIIEAFGNNSKWKWSWPEIQFKIAVLAKNLFDFRAYERENDLDNPYYYTRLEHYNLIIELSNNAAQEYRSKFDLSTNDVNDLKKSIALLEMNRKIFQITGNNEDMVRTKTLIESLNAKVSSLEGDKNKLKKKKK
jgi:hypothetical protein